MMNILLCLPRVKTDCVFYRGPSMGDDEYPVVDIQSNEVIDQLPTSERPVGLREPLNP